VAVAARAHDPSSHQLDGRCVDRSNDASRHYFIGLSALVGINKAAEQKFSVSAVQVARQSRHY